MCPNHNEIPEIKLLPDHQRIIFLTAERDTLKRIVAEGKRSIQARDRMIEDGKRLSLKIIRNYDENEGIHLFLGDLSIWRRKSPADYLDKKGMGND